MPVVAALIVSLGALIGIVLGANFAAERVSAQIFENRRLFEDQLDENRVLFKEQLEAESVRVQMQLDAAEKRLEQQLRSERLRQDRSELRDTLDEGAELLAQTVGKFIDAELEIESAEKRDWGEDPEDGSLPVAAQRDRLETFEALTSYWQRLLIRFALDDPLPEAVHSAMNVYNSAMGLLDVPEREIDEDLVAVFLKTRPRFRNHYLGFLDQCRKRFGVNEN